MTGDEDLIEVIEGTELLDRPGTPTLRDEHRRLRQRQDRVARRVSKPVAPAGFCVVPNSGLRAGLLLALAISLPACATSSQGSIGAVLSRDRQSGAVHVRETPSNQAAAKAGLLPGDRLKMIDGQLLDPLVTKEVQGLLRGRVGSSVQLTVLRGREVIHLELTRGPLAGSDRVTPNKQILKD